MFIVAFFIWVLVFIIFQTSFNGKTTPVADSRNVTLYNLITEDEMTTWLQDSSLNETDLLPIDKYTHSSSPNVIEDYDKNDRKSDFEIDSLSLNNGQLADDPNQITLSEEILEILLSQPSISVEPDWPVVLGHFDHYDDENWNNYLLETQVPLLVRWYLTDAPESVYIYQTFTNSKGEKLIRDKPSQRSSKNFKVMIETSSWLLTHESTFHLGETFIEHDIDGTDSKNTFFFSSPRLLIHNKIKADWKTTIVRHFDETGLNMTFIDRERMIVARRYLKRVS